jgi:hypothetical protein
MNLGDAWYCFAKWARAKGGGALKKQKLSVAARDVLLQWVGDSMGDEAVAISQKTFSLASSDKAVDVLSNPACAKLEADNDFFRSLRLFYFSFKRNSRML